MLQGVLDSARSLTGARYGTINLVDDSFGLLDVLFSGITEEEGRQFREMPGGMELLRYFSELRVADVNAHLRSMGLPEFGPTTGVGEGMTFLLSPVTHRGERVGNILLGGKEGEQEFTQEDEETLVLFAVPRRPWPSLTLAGTGGSSGLRADLEGSISLGVSGCIAPQSHRTFNRRFRLLWVCVLSARTSHIIRHDPLLIQTAAGVGCGRCDGAGLVMGNLPGVRTPH